MANQEQNSLQDKHKIEQLTNDSIELLKQLIAIPSFSKEENLTADLLQRFLKSKGVTPFRMLNNVWARNKHYASGKPTILLNSHHDTVKPNSGYTNNPYEAIVKDGKLFGLGSNDAGGCLVSLLAVFMYYYDKENLPYNIVYAASAEEEISGLNGIEVILPELENVEFAIVGEPTQMHLAVSEKGLIVMDCTAHGKSGHAAREEGENAIYKALKDINWFITYKFPKVSETLGPIKMSVTVIHSGSQHNVVPDKCDFVVDVRVTDAYKNAEIFEIIKQHVTCDVKPRSLRLTPSSISMEHPIVKAGLKLGRETYGSPTTSDQALMNFPSLKLGPGFSGRSHTADEFIFLSEIEEGVQLYITMLNQVLGL
jgi:acetylornithine deacetylase